MKPSGILWLNQVLYVIELNVYFFDFHANLMKIRFVLFFSLLLPLSLLLSYVEMAFFNLFDRFLV